MVCPVVSVEPESSNSSSSTQVCSQAQAWLREDTPAMHSPRDPTIQSFHPIPPKQMGGWGNIFILVLKINNWDNKQAYKD